MSEENKIEEIVIHATLLDEDFNLGELRDLLPKAFEYAEIDDILEISMVDALEDSGSSPYKIKE